MSEKKYSVLFMDDQPSENIIERTCESIEQAGYSLDFVSTMSQAIEAYYHKFYDVFVLDIDMSHLIDEQEGDGVKVLKRFVSLHNQTKVIMFSGAGTVKDWFEAANAHCFAYVHKKEDGIESLLKHIQQVTQFRAPSSSPLRKETCPSKILVVSSQENLIAPAQETILSVLGAEWQIVQMSLEHANSCVLQEYGIVLAIQNEFSSSEVEEVLPHLFSSVPKPQVIVGCEAKDENITSILPIVNLHPFRMIDLTNPQWQTSLADALKDAVTWYGKQEIFPADMDALKRIHITLPEDVLEEWESDDYELDEADLANNEQQEEM
ncbi:response regulator [Deltaproteobacteria bacterium TL4]